jgi:hypothetical protein
MGTLVPVEAHSFGSSHLFSKPTLTWSSQEPFSKEIVLRATADGLERYLAFEVSGD